MKIFLLCEKLTANYGVDRTVKELYNRLSKSHEVFVITERIAKLELNRNRENFYEIGTTENLGLIDHDKQASKKALRLINSLFPDSLEKIAIVSNGWPFISISNLVSPNANIETIFIDYGCVPLTRENSISQLALRELRETSVSNFTKVAAISKYIWDSETSYLAVNDEQEIMPLGADHVLQYQKFDLEKKNQIFFLGRYEEGYKGAQHFKALVNELRRSDPEIVGVHTGISNQGDPKTITGLGLLSDEELFTEIQQSKYAVSLSVWEGFNLPVAEAETLGVPTFCFSIGPHPTVIREKKHLSVSIKEMAEKIGSCKCSSEVNELIWTWDKSADFLLNLISEETIPKETNQILFVDVTNTLRDSGNSGVVRVNRKMLSAMNRLEISCIPIEHDGWEFRVPVELGYLGLNGGPNFQNSVLWQKLKGMTIDDSIDLIETIHNYKNLEIGFLIIEVHYDQNIVERISNLPEKITKKLVYIHDLIPITNPEYVSSSIAEKFINYLKAVKLFDEIVCSTEFQRSIIEKFGFEEKQITVIPYGAFNSKTELKERTPIDFAKRIQILMVSTVEPRKGHLDVIDAFASVNEALESDKQIDLILIGNMYEEKSNYHLEFERRLSQYSWIKYLGNVPDEILLQWMETVDFQIYGSEIEGFGLPVLESVLTEKNIVIRKLPCFEHFKNYPYVHLVDFDNMELISFLKKIQAGVGIRELEQENLSKISLEDVRKIHDWEIFSIKLLDRFFPKVQFNVIGESSDHSFEGSSFLWKGSNSHSYTIRKLIVIRFFNILYSTFLPIVKKHRHSRINALVPEFIKIRIYQVHHARLRGLAIPTLRAALRSYLISKSLSRSALKLFLGDKILTTTDPAENSAKNGKLLQNSTGRIKN